MDVDDLLLEPFLMPSIGVTLAISEADLVAAWLALLGLKRRFTDDLNVLAVEWCFSLF